MYGQIISFLFVLLIIYYVVMILLDIQKAKAVKAAELEKNSEEDIDISDEANTFQPIVISRDEPKKPQAAEQETEEKKGESAGQSESEDCHQPKNTNESGQDKKESPVDKPSPENATPVSTPSSAANIAGPANPKTEKKKPESDETGKDDTTEDDKRQTAPFRREGYREPLMTDAIPVDQLLNDVDEFVESGEGPLGEIIHECRSAHF